jgi:hypothetical protein
MLLYGNHTAPSAFPSTWAICIFFDPQDQHSLPILLIFVLTWSGKDPDTTVLFLLLDGRGGGGMRLLLDAIVSIDLGLRKTRDEIEAVYRMNRAQLTRHNQIFKLSRFVVNLLMLCHIGLGRSDCFLQLDFLFLRFVA